MKPTAKEQRRVLLLVVGIMAVLIAIGLAQGAEPEPEPRWAAPVKVAAGEAHQGPWRMNESDFRYVDAPSVDLNTRGVAAVVWVDQAQKDVFFQAYDAQGAPLLEEPVNVSRSPDTFSWLPRVVVTDHDPIQVYVLWQEIVFSGGSHGGEIHFARSLDGGLSFSAPANLSRTPAGAGKGRLTRDRWDNGSLELAMGPEGELHAAWTEYEGALRVATSTDGGASFSDPVTVVEAGGPDPARGPALAVDHRGRIHLAWTVGEDPAGDLRWTRSDDGGRSFQEPRKLFETSGHADAPALGVDARGMVHLAYAEARDGPVGSYRIHYGHWPADEDPGAVELREISSSQGAEFESVAFPTLGLDAGGHLYVIWELFPSRLHRPQGLGITWSEDGGATFQPPSVVPGTTGRNLGFNGSLQGLLGRKLAVNRAGTIAVVNSTFNPGERSRVRLVVGEVVD